MLLTENLRQALNSLRINKNRTILTMIGIIIGLSSVLSIVSIGDTLGSVIDNYFVQYIAGGNIVYFASGYDKDSSEWTDKEYSFSRDEIYDLIDSSDGLILDIEYSARAEFEGSIKIDSGHKAEVSICGESSAYDITSKLQILSGRFISRDECRYIKPVAVISDIAAKACFGSCDAAIGQTIDYQGEYTTSYYDQEKYQMIYSDPKKVSAEFTVVGVYKYVEPSAILSGIQTGDKTNLICPASFCKYTLLKDDSIFDDSDWYRFVIKNSESVEYCKDLISEFAEAKYGDDPEYIYSYLDLGEDLSMIDSIITIITASFIVIAAISLLVGGIGLMNTMLVSVTERTKEIGIKKALGARNSAIRTQFLFESAVLCLIACAIGIFIGMLTGMIIETNLDKLVSLIPGEELQYFILNNEIHVTPSLNAIVVSTLFSLAVGIIFGLYPANKGAKMQPVDALRYE